MRRRSAILALPLLLALEDPDGRLPGDRQTQDLHPTGWQFSQANKAVIHRVVTELVARRRFSLR